MNFSGKYALLCRLIRDHNCQSFVETGTYEARMSLAISDILPNVRTIELSETLHQDNVERIAKAKKENTIMLICDHSVKGLPTALHDAGRPLVWLDAHWSAGKTTRDDSGSDTPVVAELQTLSALAVDGVVAIDDIRCFDGQNGYPTVDALMTLITSLWPETTPTRDDDVIWFVTKG